MWLTWEEWALIGAQMFGIGLVALAAWDATRPRSLPRRPLPFPTRREYYPTHAQRTTQDVTRDLGRYRGRVVPPSDWDDPRYPS